MKAVRVHAYGEDARIDDVPEPEITGPWDVLVQVGAAGVCRTDLHILEGQWDALQRPTLPYILGHENAGWVLDVGSAVTNVAPGDTVIMHPVTSCGLCPPCRAGQDSHCENSTFPGLNTDGGMAELLKTNARAVVKLDASVRPADVAALADAGLTAYHAVRRAVPLLPPGSEAVVIGAGGLGHIGVQSLKALTGAHITVVDTSDEALALAKELGADATVNPHDLRPAARAVGEPFVEAVVLAVLDITCGGAHVVFDFVGERGTEITGPAMLRNRGSYYAIGYGGTLALPTIDLISREISVVGNLVGTYQDLAELMTLNSQGEITLHTTTYDLLDAVQALHDLDAGKLTGRAVLVPDRG
ncbi:NAD(P)-dependent alcohol dehydrogenase [Arthrobacter caoxuetaonis]|uniref:alcohol dehydrogenase n=1 Tax=Arthrobacter caoxuetaonis TaxID=2886935 RepID=A0A9X1MCH3_9MICC|nr:NAD(P)-dependent alcohol dehydrogenase [Arthrobacter caoxuetaonis]MCC3297513.1 NAD(P)-dependent alcohol dehydrogenase [Arthrobacter caoxuetaonis]USQ57955.1 NAD(P)-dependent alcohol dehydrogenase [Arthrobacter caoxuetaonis]